MINRIKLLSESKSESNKTLQEVTKVTETNIKQRESYEKIQTLNYAYIKHLEIIFGRQLATLVNILYVQL